LPLNLNNRLSHHKKSPAILSGIFYGFYSQVWRFISRLMDLFFIRTCFLNDKFYCIFLDIFFYFYLLSLYLLKK